MAFESSLSYSWDALVKQLAEVHLTLPPASHFRFPPAPLPPTLPPPSDHPTLAHPFTISHSWYNRMLAPEVPITIALVYVTIVTILNSVNRQRKFKPWAFSKTTMFKFMVITHNAILAAYSLWTFVGMFNALNASVEPPWAEYGLAGTVDSLCKINGPRGYGSAATFNETTSSWGIANHLYRLGPDGRPDQTDVGRMWNEGLAFYGWLFYLSKFYEVIDTLIILAKGKKSSFLQTYHHAGAMMCMWAGIRYMSPPIWMFALVNSFIHTIMYSFYFCSVLNIRIPVWFKRTLTTLQITQFVLGVIYAFAHLFIKYRSPASISYLYHVGSTASTIPSVVSSTVSTVTATASADTAAQVKKWLLRAAGREGLAENVLNRQGETFGIDAVHAANDFVAREEIRYRRELRWVHCIDTSGQTFAIYLNCLYLLPLTWLFGRFFVKSYLRRDERRRSSTTSQKAFLSSRDAYKGVTRRLSEAFEDPQQGSEGESDDVAVIDGEELKTEVKTEVKKIASATKKGMSGVLEDTKDKADLLKAKAKNEFQADFDKLKQTFGKTREDLASSSSEQVDTNDRTESQGSDILHGIRESVAETAQSLSQKLQQSSRSVQETVSKLSTQAQGDQQGKSIVSNVKNDLKDKAQAASDNIDQVVSTIQDKIKPDQSSEAAKAPTNDGKPKRDTQPGKDVMKNENDTSQEEPQAEQSESKPRADSARQTDSPKKRTPAEAAAGNSKSDRSPTKGRVSKDNAAKDASAKSHSEEKSASQNGSQKENSAESPVHQHDDQQSSWIHIKHDTEKGLKNAKANVNEQIENLKAEAVADRDVVKQSATQKPEKHDASVSKATPSKTSEETKEESASSAKTEKQSKAGLGSKLKSTGHEGGSGASPKKGSKQPPRAGEAKHVTPSNLEHNHPTYAEAAAEPVAEASDSKEPAIPSKKADKQSERSSAAGAAKSGALSGAHSKQKATTETSEPVKKQDKIIDESESVRDEVITNTEEGVQGHGTDQAGSSHEADKKEHEEGA